MGREQVKPELLDLLRSVADGDRVAFSELYDVVVARIYGLSWGMLDDPASAERATQESFLEIWRRAPQYDSGTNRPITWMLTIAHRRARALVRSAEVSARKIA